MVTVEWWTGPVLLSSSSSVDFFYIFISFVSCCVRSMLSAAAGRKKSVSVLFVGSAARFTSRHFLLVASAVVENDWRMTTAGLDWPSFLIYSWSTELFGGSTPMAY